MQIAAFYLLSLVFACLAMLLWQLPESERAMTGIQLPAIHAALFTLAALLFVLVLRSRRPESGSARERGPADGDANFFGGPR